jgi:hypothetical protein
VDSRPYLRLGNVSLNLPAAHRATRPRRGPLISEPRQSRHVRPVAAGRVRGRTRGMTETADRRLSAWCMRAGETTGRRRGAADISRRSVRTAINSFAAKVACACALLADPTVSIGDVAQCAADYAEPHLVLHWIAQNHRNVLLAERCWMVFEHGNRMRPVSSAAIARRRAESAADRPGCPASGCARRRVRA